MRAGTPSQRLDTLSLEFDRELRAARLQMLHPERPVFTWQLIKDFAQAQQRVARTCMEELRRPASQRLHYLVISSRLAGVFCLGGDLALFVKLIERGDRTALSEYAHACTDLLQRTLSGADGGLCTIALIQGQTLGGGFEAALASEAIIAEEQACFGFPEIQFGLFPGMGAFSLLARRIGPALAKRIILSGHIYTARELYEMGVVDHLAERGHGEELLRHYLEKRHQREGGYDAMARILSRHQPLEYEELNRIVDLWVDTAMELSPKNLSMMRFLLRAQQERWGHRATALPDHSQTTATPPVQKLAS